VGTYEQGDYVKVEFPDETTEQPIEEPEEDEEAEVAWYFAQHQHPG